ncbi:MAG TPA: cation:proton antiporter [Geobacteraceae bacterium]|nr:cation:proton antiporter [Geobacteraceae bacterium]
MDPVVQMTLMLAVLLLLGALGEFIFSRTGIPDMIWLVAAGIVAGPVFKMIKPEVLTPALPFFGALALIIILLGGGLKFRIADVADAAPRALELGLAGFFFSVFATCLYALVLIEFNIMRPAPLEILIMGGAIIGGTSSMVVIPTMAGGMVDQRVARLLEVESCSTDALCVVVTIVMIEIILLGKVHAAYPFLALAKAAGFGMGIGAVGGLIYLPFMPHLKGKGHAYTVLIAWFLIVYSVVTLTGGNGALGVLVCALLIGNASDLLPKLYERIESSEFRNDESAMIIHSQLTFFVKTFFFFLIGLLFPTELKFIIIGAGLAVVLVIARIPSVLLSLWRGGFTPQQQKLVMVSIPRGLAAGVLSTLPLYSGVPNMENLAPVIFSTIVFSILIFAGGFAILNRRSASG